MSNVSSHSKINNLLLDESKIFSKVSLMLDVTIVSHVIFNNRLLTKKIEYNKMNVLIGNEIAPLITKSIRNGVYE